jgi:hypothetical protein
MKLTPQAFLVVCIQACLATLFATAVSAYVLIQKGLEPLIIGVSLGVPWVTVLGMLAFFYQSVETKEKTATALPTEKKLGFNLSSFNQVVLPVLLGLGFWFLTLMLGINPDLVSRIILVVLVGYFVYKYRFKRS